MVCTRTLPSTTSQRSNARRVRSSRHNFTKENTDKRRKFHFNQTLNAISENLSFLLWAFVQNEVTGIHKFYRRDKTCFIGTFYVSFSYELRPRHARKSLNWFKLQGSAKPEVKLFFAFDRCEVYHSN